MLWVFYFSLQWILHQWLSNQNLCIQVVTLLWPTPWFITTTLKSLLYWWQYISKFYFGLQPPRQPKLKLKKTPSMQWQMLSCVGRASTSGFKEGHCLFLHRPVKDISKPQSYFSKTMSKPSLVCDNSCEQGTKLQCNLWVGLIMKQG